MLSSLNGYSLFLFNLDNNKINNMQRVRVNERIRDIFFKDDELFYFLRKNANDRKNIIFYSLIINKHYENTSNHVVALKL